MLTAKEILDALTYDGNIEVDGDEAIRIVNRLIDLQEQKLNKAPVVGRSEQLPDFKDQLVTNSSIGQLLAKIHDDIEGRYNLDVGDLQDVENILMLCQ